MFKLAVIALATVLVALTTLASAQSDSYEEHAIRCKVCERAIGYIWHQGNSLRAHCKGEDRSDPRCDFSNVHHYGIEEMTTEVCDKLPKTHRAIEGSEFDLILHESEDAGELHTKQNAAKIRNTCIRFIHDVHGIDQVSLYMFANLDAGKSTGTILHSLKHRFCKKACDPNFKISRNVEDPEVPNARFRDGHDRSSPNDL